MTQANPQTIYLKDYKAPHFLIETVDLEFELGEDVTHVKSKLQIQANPENQEKENKLVLNGESLELKTIALNGNELNSSQFHIADNLLTISNVPEKFILEIHTIIKPQENTALSGLYKSS